MTCILVAHLGDEVIIAADKRVTQITEHGARIPCGDNEEDRQNRGWHHHGRRLPGDA